VSQQRLKGRSGFPRASRRFGSSVPRVAVEVCGAGDLVGNAFSLRGALALLNNACKRACMLGALQTPALGIKPAGMPSRSG
jgi:hypothetical protein